MSEPISLRAHHGMCLAFFRGKGYSSDFSAHMQAVHDGMKGNPSLRIVAEGDIICGHCPKLEQGICRSAEKVLSYDRQVLAACGLTEGAELDWETFSKLVRERILVPGKREEICADCQWTSLCK